MENWESALYAYDAGQFEKALDIFSCIAETARIVMNIAFIHATLDEHENAVNGFTKAIGMDPSLAIAYFQRGVSNYLLHRHEDALRDFNEAFAQLKSNSIINYEQLGLRFKLFRGEVLFNKGLAQISMGYEEEGLLTLRVASKQKVTDKHRLIDDAIQANGNGYMPFSIPVGILYRPTEGSTRALQEDTSVDGGTFIPPLSVSSTAYPIASSKSSGSTSQQSYDTRSSLRKSFQSSRRSDASSTYAPTMESDTVSRKGSMTSAYTWSSFTKPPEESYSFAKPTRYELNAVIGDDIITPTTEISSIPCAGVRISHGRLTGLMAWRFVVQLDEPSAKFRNCARPGIVTNFILDTGSGHSTVPPETLRALGYTGSLRPGREVMLSVQGVRTKCAVAHPEEAGRLCGAFMTAGSLTFYFDSRLDAPVLYVADEDLDGPKPENIPRTIQPVAFGPKFKKMVMSVISLGRLSTS